MTSTYENLSFTEGMDLDLLRSLIADQVIPEDCDPGCMTQADWDNFHADMAAMPLDLPTNAEIEQMARDRGIPVLPF